MLDRLNATFALGLLCAVTGTSVLGQNVLDAGLSKTDGRLNQQRADQSMYRDRNLVITNNVAAGRGFRGSVGYSAERDFRGITASNDLHGFLADSAWSDVNFINYGSTFQRMRYGQDAGLLEIPRTAAGATRSTVLQQVYSPTDVVSAKLKLDTFTEELSVANALRMSPEPRHFGYTTDEEGRAQYVGASSLLGVTELAPGEDAQRFGLTVYDLARMRNDAVEGRPGTVVGKPFPTGFEDLRIGARREDGPVDSIVDGTKAAGTDEVGADDEEAAEEELSDFDRIRREVAERYSRRKAPDAETPAETEKLDADFDKLRRELQGASLADGSPDERRRLDEAERRGTDDRPADVESGDEVDEDERENELPMRDLGEVLRHGEQIERLAGHDEGRFNELLAEAEASLRSGEYFKAERRFTRALRFTPGHPLATAGLIHAEIGAGLYVPASLKLRSLFSFQPEMIDARYAPDLVPNRTRLSSAASMLEARIADDVRDRAQNALLLAYVGRLLGDGAVVRNGLDVMAREDPDDALVALLEQLWVEQGE